MGIAAILQLLLPVLTTGLGIAGVIPAGLLPLIGASGSAVSTLIGELVSGKQSVTSVSLAALQAVQAEIAALKQSTTLMTINQANEIMALDAAIGAAIAAFQKSQVVTDPSNMTPLPTNLQVDQTVPTLVANPAVPTVLTT